MPALNEMPARTLLRRMGLPDAPVIIDVSIDADFEADPFLIPTAPRHPFTQKAELAAELATELAGRKAVIACQKGRKLSQGMTAWLRAKGIDAEYLEGGNYGWRDLPDAPRVPAAQLPPQTDGASLWVTRHRPKIDRIACPWLIRRFIDPAAVVLFVAPAEVADIADRYGATPFDVPDVRFSHGAETCTFDAMLEVFGLQTPALTAMAEVIRAADRGTHAASPQAAGLLALSVGLSRQYRDDSAQLEAGLPFYDALYRWARDGQDEQHSWQSGHGA